MTTKQKMIKLSEILELNAKVISDKNPRNETTDAIYYTLTIISNCIKELFDDERK